MKPYLSILTAWGLSFGYAVGWGAFVMPGSQFLPGAGPAGTVIGIAVGTLAMAVIGWNYYRMVSACPGAGGAYAYAQKAFGADCGYLTAWSLALAYMAILWANATALVLLVRYMFGDVLQFGWHDTLAGFDIYLGEVLLSVVVMVFAGGVCLWRKRLAGRVQAALAAFMLVGVATCFFFALSRHEGGLSSMGPAFAPSEAGPVSQVLCILAMMPWAFVGFEAISHSSAEFAFPVKKLWRVLAAAIVSSAAMYAMLAFLPVLAHPDAFTTWADYISGKAGLAGLDSMPTFAAAQIVFGRGGIALLGGTMFAGIFTGIVAATVAMSRLLYALSEDGIFPACGAWLGRLDKNGQPRNAILAVVGVSLAIPFFGRTVIGWPVEVSSIGAAVAYCVTSAAAFKLARGEGDRLTAATGAAGIAMSIVFCLLLLVPNYISGSALSAESYLVLALWCIAGFALYWRVFKNDSRQRFGKSHIVWTGIVVLIFFSMLMRVRLATQNATNRAVNSITEQMAHHCFVHHGTTNPAAIKEEQRFVVEKMDELNGTRLREDLVQVSLLSASLLIIFALYTTQRSREEALLVEKAKMDERERAKSLFFSTVSHDIRTPLNAIIGFSEMLKHGIDTKSEYDLAVNSIHQSGEMLRQLVNDLLDLTKLESGKMDIHAEPTDVAQIVREIAFSFYATHQKPGLEILCRAGDTPTLMVDPHRIRQIAFNFMSNAVKFTKKGFIKIEASFRPDETGASGEFRLSVEDTGCGIGEENLKRLAAPFVQVGDIAARRTGTGLGLYICRMLAMAMGGDMEIKSVLGKGSTFSIVVPGVRVVESEGVNSPTPPLTHSPTNLRLLIADDTKMNQIVLRAMFSKLGIKDLTFADNGREALDILKDTSVKPFDLVLTDFVMPEMTGEELVAAIRADPVLSSLKVYLFTADVEMKKTYAEKGFDGILLKPANLEALREILPLHLPLPPTGNAL
jgi:signal transduction histidine kinase/CheY-like chemotaxis protein